MSSQAKVLIRHILSWYLWISEILGVIKLQFAKKAILKNVQNAIHVVDLTTGIKS